MAIPITVKFLLTRESYAELCKALGKRSTGLSSRGWGILLWILLTFPTRAILEKAFSLKWPMELQLLVAAAVSGAVTFWIRRNALQRQRAGFVEDDEIEYRFSEAGIDKRTRRAESKLEWGIYARFWETDEVIFLCYPNQTVDPVPKKAFASADDLAAFKELLSRKVKSGATDPHPVWGRTRKWFVYALLFVIALMIVLVRQFAARPPGK